MDLTETCYHLLHGRRSSSVFCSWLLVTPRYTWHHTPVENESKLTFRIRTYNPLISSPVMSTTKGKSTTSRGLCKVVWAIEAELADGQVLYVTGDPFALGCWEPDMAIPMTPCLENSNVWKAEIRIPCGVNFKYNYFIKGDAWPVCDIIWRPGPEFSLSVPLNGIENRNIIVRDSWMRHNTKMPPAHMWGSWMECEGHPPIEPLILGPTRDEDDIVKSFTSDSMESKVLLENGMKGDEYPSSKDAVVTAVVKGLKSDSNENFLESDQPIEEPWLVLPNLSIISSALKLDNLQKGELSYGHSHEQHYKMTEQLLPAEEGSLMAYDDSVSTVILINSSICTMQRIGILEDGNLVELLLEPVKSNVQCDSIFLGVVTKLVPHMGGAFVNIGSNRPSLMDIKNNRGPFIFPPFRQRPEEKEVNDCVFGTLKHENDEVTEVEYQNDSTEFNREDLEEDGLEEDLDVSEVVKSNINGGVVDDGGAEADFEDSLDGNEGHNTEYESSENKWFKVRKGTKIIVQVVKEGLGTKGPTLTAYPKLRSRFWILITRCSRIGVSKKISGVERTRLRVIAKTLQPKGFGVTVRTVAAGHSLEELKKDLEGLVLTWEDIMGHAKSAALAADEGVEGAIPVILHRAMGQTLSVVQDYFNEKVKCLVVDSPRTYHEVTNYLQEIAPDLCDRVELYNKSVPLFDEFGIEQEINNMLSKRVPLSNGGSLVIEQTEALVSVDVNGGHSMLGQGTSQEKAILDVNLAAAKQIARELRLRDIGGIIVVDFIDMMDDANKRLVYEEVKKAVQRDRSMVKVSELSRHGLMEITRKRVRPSVTFMISEPCACCHATGRVEALETSFSKIEHEICRWLAMMDQKADPGNPKSWPRFILRVDRYMCTYLTSGKRTRIAILTSSLKVWILLKVARGFTRGAFEVKPLMDDKANINRPQISMLQPTDAVTYNPGRKVTLFPVKKWKTSGK